MNKSLIIIEYTNKNIIPIKVYMAALPLIIFATISSDLDLGVPKNLILWSTVSVLSVLLCVIYILFWKYLMFNQDEEKKVPFLLVLFMGASLGAIKSLSTYYLAVFFGLFESSDFETEAIPRLLAAIFLGIWIVATSPIISGFIDRYKKSMQDLIIFGANIEKKNYEVETEINLMKTRINHEFGDALVEILESSKSYLSADNDVQQKLVLDNIVDQIRETNHTNVRPASHRLWLESAQVLPDLDFKTLLSSSLRLNPFPIPIVILVFLASTIVELYTDFGFSGLLVSAINAVTIFVFFSIFKTIFRDKKLRLTDFFVVILLTISTMNIINNLLFLNQSFYNSIINIFIGFFWLSYLTLAVSLLSTAKIKRDTVLSQLNTLVDKKLLENIRLRESQNMINFQLSKFMHGQIQNNLMLAASNLEKSIRNNDKNLIEVQLADLSRDIEENFGIINELDGKSDLFAHLESLKIAWSGICSITFEISEGFNSENRILYRRIVEAVSEGVSNAVHHGSAQNVSITISRLSDEIVEIKISDNGSGLQGNNQGLGNKIFENLAGKNWSLKNLPSGAGAELTLKFYLPE